MPYELMLIMGYSWTSVVCYAGVLKEAGAGGLKLLATKVAESVCPPVWKVILRTIMHTMGSELCARRSSQVDCSIPNIPPDMSVHDEDVSCHAVANNGFTDLSHMVGWCVNVWWPHERRWYAGMIASRLEGGIHIVYDDDGEVTNVVERVDMTVQHHISDMTYGLGHLVFEHVRDMKFTYHSGGSLPNGRLFVYEGLSQVVVLQPSDQPPPDQPPPEPPPPVLQANMPMSMRLQQQMWTTHLALECEKHDPNTSTADASTAHAEQVQAVAQVQHPSELMEVLHGSSVWQQQATMDWDLFMLDHHHSTEGCVSFAAGCQAGASAICIKDITRRV
jgi:hypothetical protein